MKLPADWREFIELLAANSVDYVLVGGHAVAHHGYPRYTGDIDFLYRPDAENARKLRAVLDEFGFGSLALEPEEMLGENVVIQLGRPPNRIDLLAGITGVSFDDAWRGRELARIDGIDVPVIGRAELIRNKLASGRRKDLLDVDMLE